MASTPATGAIGVELQAAGENLNTWGDPKLNNALQILVNLAHGWKAWTINGNYSVSETNYATTNDTENAFIKLVAGTVAAAFNVTLPGRNKRLIMWNATSYAATVKLSATSGVVLPAGGFAIIATDGVTDVYNASPTHAGTTTQSTATNAYALWGAVETAIAAASGLTAPFILVSGTDTTAGYLGQKIVGSGAASVSVINSGADEDVQISVGSLAVTDGGTQAAGFTAASNARYNCVFGASGTITLPAAPTAKDVIVLHLAGNYVYTLNPNGLKINSSTSNFPMLGNQTVILEYTGATDGWV